MSVYDAIGMISVLCFLGSYAGMQLGYLRCSSFFYSFCNFIGAIGVLFSISQHFTLAVTVIQISWAIMSLYGMLKALTVKIRYRQKAPT